MAAAQATRTTHNIVTCVGNLGDVQEALLQRTSCDARRRPALKDHHDGVLHWTQTHVAERNPHETLRRGA
jgi:hypothetical protein